MVTKEELDLVFSANGSLKKYMEAYESAFVKTISSLRIIYENKQKAVEGAFSSTSESKRIRKLLQLADCASEHEQFAKRALRHLKQFKATINRKFFSSLTQDLTGFVNNFCDSLDGFFEGMLLEITIQIRAINSISIRGTGFLFKKYSFSGDASTSLEALKSSIERELKIYGQLGEWSRKMADELAGIFSMQQNFLEEFQITVDELRAVYRNVNTYQNSQIYDIIKKKTYELEVKIRQWENRSRYLDLRPLLWLYQKHLDYLKNPKRLGVLVFLVYYHMPGTFTYPATLVITCVMTIAKSIKFNSKSIAFLRMDM